MAGELQRLRAIVFDFDGTLLDSYSSHIATYEVTLSKFGIHFSETEFKSVYTPDWYRVYEALGLGREFWKEADRVWLEEISKHPSAPYPGVERALTRLRGLYPLAIVTSGSRARVLEDLNRNRLGHLFETVVTNEDIRKPKPAPEGLQIALERMGCETSEALYVGDVQADAEMAQSLEVPFIGVKSPFSADQFELNSFVVLPSVGTLPAYLEAALGNAGLRPEL